MTRDIYVLEIPRENLSSSTEHHPAIILISSIIYALAVTSSSNIYSLLIASILPARFISRVKLSALAKLNLINAVMILTLALTWPTPSGLGLYQNYYAGFMMGVIISLRVNMICVAFSAMVYPLGIGGMYEALCFMRVPENLRVLMILTLRGINILRERYEAAIISVKLRAPNIHGVMRLKIFACILGNVLLQSLERSDNMMKAVKCRGGFGGFMQSENHGISFCDAACVMGFAFYGIIIAVMNYA